MKSMKEICKNCGICCQNTEMLLSEQDIRLIEEKLLNITRNDFTELNERGMHQLKNKNSHCVFLDNSSKMCTIYKIRPQGCRFYPIVYDYNKKVCLYDRDCPRVKKFYLDDYKFKKVCEKIKNFIKSGLKVKL
ncbi:MAG: YkgJ family cysteine cluster protein [Promethearchaeota archaeon]